MQQLADATTKEGLKAVKKPATKKAMKKKARRAPRTAAETARLTAKILKLRSADLSYRAIEFKLAKDLGLDPTSNLRGFVAFRMVKAAGKKAKAA